MKKLDRASIAAPPSLAEPSGAVANETAEAAAYYGSRVPWTADHTSYEFRNYRGLDVKRALRELAGGNCAYCESKIGAVGAREVEHYRPKGGIAGLALHPGYWWLANRWDNLLPTCRDCNKSLRQHIITAGMTEAEVLDLLVKRPEASFGKANQFEIRGQRAVGSGCNLDLEDPLLIDPCQTDPNQHLTWDFSVELTLIEPVLVNGSYSVYGAYTIETCALNRAELVLDRIPALRPMRVIRTRLIDRLNRWAGEADQLEDILLECETLSSFARHGQPYAGMAAAFIRDFEDELDRWRVSRGLPQF
ncbi:HNH endonuclease [Paracoccus sanguinis]|uniref:HNH endonuclease n=1 Tax=Paracoccus sanguinis TaxID=1545044 RepID=UPI0012DFFE68|nr:hypothetical protein [Paracoccus sanguinis]